MNVLVIVNPVSGGGRGAVLGEHLYRELAGKGINAEKRVTQRAGDARAWAAETADCIAVVGGDGTVNEAANGLSDANTRLAILPLGTANVVARELGIPGDASVVSDLIARGVSRSIDAGRCGGRRFLLGVGAGLDAAVVDEVHRARGARLSYAGYVLPALRVLARYGFPSMRVQVDGEVVCDDAQYVVAGNCRYSAGVFALTPRATLDDGLLDVCALRNLSYPRLVRLAAAAFRPGFAERADVVYRQGREVLIAPVAADPAPVQIDGDPAGAVPVQLTVEPAAIRVVAPVPYSNPIRLRV